MLSFFALLVGYLIGSIDFAVLVGKLNGVDIYSVGSGNPGTSNVLRTMGKSAAAAVLIGDLLKGVVAAAVGGLMAPTGDGILQGSALAAAAGTMAVVGHCYPAFHKLKGGKGVATGFGVLLWVSPIAALILGVTWAVIVKLTKVASIGSLIVVVAAIPLLFWQGAERYELFWVGVALLLIIWRHKGNIARIRSGGEAKVVEV